MIDPNPLSPTVERGPLERSEHALGASVLQMGLYAEMVRAETEGQLTPEIRAQFAAVFAATAHAGEA